DGFDEPVEDLRSAPIPGRRRALSLTEESGPSELLDYAPLPGADAEIVMLAEEEPPALEDEALDLTAFADHSPEPVEESETAEAPVPRIEDPVVASTPVAAEQTRPFDVPSALAAAEIDPIDVPLRAE